MLVLLTMLSYPQSYDDVISKWCGFSQRTKSIPEVLVFREGKVIIQHYPLTVKSFLESAEKQNY